MRKIISLAVGLALYTLPNFVSAGLNDYPNVAVLPFANKAIVSQELGFKDANLVSEFVIEDLIDSDRFSVLEREQLMAITNEYSLNYTGLVDPNSAVQVGKLAGVQYLIYGSVVGITLKDNDYGYDNSALGGASVNNRVVEANITMRVINVETGKIMLAAHGKGVSSSAKAEFRLNVAKDTPYEATEYDSATGEEYIMEGSEESVLTHKITIGAKEVSQIQVHNAIYKAVGDAIYGKRGLLAKMDGKVKNNKYKYKRD